MLSRSWPVLRAPPCQQFCRRSAACRAPSMEPAHQSASSSECCKLLNSSGPATNTVPRTSSSSITADRHNGEKRTCGLHDCDAERIVTKRRQHSGEEGRLQRLINDGPPQEEAQRVRRIWVVQAQVFDAGQEPREAQHHLILQQENITQSAAELKHHVQPLKWCAPALQFRCRKNAPPIHPVCKSCVDNA